MTNLDVNKCLKLPEAQMRWWEIRVITSISESGRELWINCLMRTAQIRVVAEMVLPMQNVPISDPIVCKLMMLPELSKAVTFTFLAIKASYYLSLCFTIQQDEGPPLQGRCKWFLLESFIWLHSVLKPVWHKVIFISTQDLYFWWSENLPYLGSGILMGLDI